MAAAALKRATSVLCRIRPLMPASLRQSSHTVSVNLCSRNVELRPEAVGDATSESFFQSGATASSPTSAAEIFPFVWLRDNCPCSECYGYNDRLVQLADFPLDVKPSGAEITKTGEVKVVWEDGHESIFSKDWLLQRSFSDHSRNKRAQRDEVEEEPILWTAKDMQGKLPSHDYRSVMENDDALMYWLQDLSQYGAALIRDAPIREGPVPDLQERVNFQKLTHYGPGYTVEVREDPSSIAHTFHRIGFHTDLTFYSYIPGTIFLHCIKQHEGEGGETLLVDGFQAAETLRASNPAAHHILSNTMLNFRDVGTDFRKFNKLNQMPIFVHDVKGRLKTINWSHFARDSHMDLNLEEVEPFYEAMRAYEDIINSEDHFIRHKMAPGDMITVRNPRVMHGRSELRGKMSGRHLQCCYMDWDEIACRLRVLKKNAKKN